MRPLAAGLARVLASVLALLLLLPLALLAVLGTEAGTRWLLDQLQRQLPALSIAAVEGKAWGPLRLQGLHYRGEGMSARIDWIELEWSPAALLVRELHIRRLHGGQLQLELAEPREEPPEAFEPPTRLPLDLRIEHAALARLQVTRSAGSPVQAERLSLAASWLGDQLRVGQAQVTLLAPALGAFAISGAARLGPDAAQVQGLRLQGPGWVEVNGHVSYAGDSDLLLQWEALRWPLQPALLQSPAGQGRVEGRPEAYRFELQGALAEARATLQFEARGAGSLQGLQLQQLQARGLGGSLEAQAALSWSPALQVEASGSFQNLQPQSVVSALDGVFNGHFKVQTLPREQGPEIRFEAALRDSHWRGHRLQAAAVGRYVDGGLHLQRGEVRSAGNQLQLSGDVWPALNARAQLRAPKLAPLWPGLKGGAQADLRLRGPVQGPALNGSLRLRELAFRQLAIRRLDFTGSLDLRGQRRWERFALQSRLSAEELAWGERTVGALQLDGRLDLQRHNDLRLDLQNARLGLAVSEAGLRLIGPARDHVLTARAETERGDVELELAGAVKLGQRRWQGSLRSAHLQPVGLPDWRLEAAAALILSPADQHLGTHCWVSAGARLCTQLDRDRQGLRGAAQLSPLPLAYLRPLLPQKWQLEGEIRGGGEFALGAQGQLERVDVTLTSTEGRWLQGGRELLGFSPSTLLLQQEPRGALTAQARLPFSGGIARLDAVLAPGSVLVDRPLAGSFTLDLPELSWLRMFTTELTTVSGRLQGHYTLGGRLAAPRIEGVLSLSDGRLRVARAGINITDLRAELHGDSGGRLRLAASGRSGGGVLQIDGELAPEGRPPTGLIVIQGEEFQAVRIPDARVWISPDLQVHLNGREVTVRGEVRIPRAEITPTTGGQGIGPSDDQIIIGEDDAEAHAPLFQYLAEIRLVLGEQVRFKGYGLAAPLGGDLTLVQQSGGEAHAFGEILLDGGKYEAYGQDLTITTGRLIYSGGYVSQPALDLKAERKPSDDVTVGVTVRGTLDRPQFALFSTPAMTQQQQLSWLVLGRPLEQTGGEGERSRLNAAALSLGLSGGDYLAQRLRTRLGVDEISIGARPSEGAEQARLTLGKHLSPRLYISYGVGLFEAANVFRLIYDLGRGFKLQTESGVESGADLLYTLER